jgi:hypothetical protein
VASAFRRASRQTHPDKPTGSKEKFERIQAAFEMIQTEKQRLLLDTYGTDMAPGAGDALGSAVDKLLPLAMGLVGGLGLVVTLVTLGPAARPNWLVRIGVVTLGGGLTVSSKTPIFKVRDCVRDRERRLL